ncbi:LysM peptidoglycan-binding domain-containing M23 family metallopeptidase [Mariprofundus ferrooxydans]|uniref:LysM peptidoglycan-binding domain-containing M23 family metallopeptidase n=1 Tax=Mariprofundus ferrooxydans TaxID=314344 RepID=UPI0003781E7C|nr:M23 family metallopeptidase [Mariprofundus ferrooxydans]
MVVARRVIYLLIAVFSLSGCFSTSVEKAALHDRSVSNSRTQIYHVRANDTLYSIGKRFGVSYRRIAARNHLRAPYRIYVGQQLYINRVAPVASNRPVARTIRHASSTKRRHSSARSSRVKVRHAKPVAKKTQSRSQHRKASASIKGKLLWPVRGTVTSRFGRRGSRMHDGIDIGAKQGTAVHAAASGEVVYSDSRLSGYGKLVIIRHGNNLFTAYAHNQRNLVRKGDKVRAGDVIARVGQTGRATGPHLHFEVRQGSTPVDPLAYLPR